METVYTRDWQIFSIKGQIVNILAFVVYMITFVFTELCQCNKSRSRQYMSECSYVSIKLGLQKQAIGQLWPAGQFAIAWTKAAYLSRLRV